MLVLIHVDKKLFHVNKKWATGVFFGSFAIGSPVFIQGLFPIDVIFNTLGNWITLFASDSNLNQNHTKQKPVWIF